MQRLIRIPVPVGTARPRRLPDAVPSRYVPASLDTAVDRLFRTMGLTLALSTFVAANAMASEKLVESAKSGVVAASHSPCDTSDVLTPPAPCPVLVGAKAECVAPIIGPPRWEATSMSITSGPQCAVGVSSGGCASEGNAWTAYASNIYRSCIRPSREYRCTDVNGEWQGVMTAGTLLYDVTVGSYGVSGNVCSTWDEPHAGARFVSEAKCPAGYEPAGTAGPCIRVKPEACPVGNPIQCAGGQKTQTEVDIAGNGSLGFTRYYSSSGFYTLPGIERPLEALGVNWRHSWQSAVVIEPSQGAGLDPYAYVVKPNGDYRHFRFSGGVWVGRSDKPDRLQEVVVGGVRTGWTFTAADDAIYRYDADGVWRSVEHAGLVTTLTYSDTGTSTTIAAKPGLLIQVTDPRGRTLDLRYDEQNYLKQVISAAGDTFEYRYSMQQDPGLPPYNRGVLLFADRPDGSTREYLYNEPAHVAATTIANLLTGIVDENGHRYGTYKYDADERANQEYHGSGANLLSLTYSGNYNAATSSTIVVDAMGQAERRRFIAVDGIVRDAGRDRCTSASCSSITHSTQITYTTDGNRNLVTDFNGSVTDYDYDSRGLEQKRTEASNASGTGSPKRTIETQWHATFQVPLLRSVKNAAGTIESLTTWAYNARAQETARCEIDPADAAAMAYTCSATVAPPTGAGVRRTVRTYCEAADVIAGSCPFEGLPVAVNGARSTMDSGMGGADDTTTLTYYATTDESGCGTIAGPCHRKGDLWKTTNALGHADESLTYDKNGRVVLIRNANSVLSGITYNARGWLTERRVYANAAPTTSAGDAVTAFAYDGTGQITLVTQPDGVALQYVYDAAHRLTDVIDSVGNRVHYTLDNAGHRIKEETFDASYNPSVPGQGLKRSLARQYNVLSRLVRELNAGAAATRDSTPYDTSPLSDGYDANGNAVQFKDGLNVQTQQTYDPLNRLVKTIQDYTGTDPETGNATVEYSYDARDNLRTVKDPDNLTTTYTYDGLGNLTDLDSPDTGHTDYAYDRAGNRTSQTDNRGVTSSYTYDALNRLRGISYPTSALNVSFDYDQGNTTTGCATSYPLGRLTRMTDATGTTTYCYDARGNVLSKTQVTAGSTLAVAYTYTLADRIATITYPSGGIATYGYDAVGRTTTLSWKTNAGATPVTVVSGISYYPFGPANVLTYGNGRTLTKTYDQDYMIDSVASSIADGLEIDFGRDVMANITSASGTLGTSPPERQYVYDNLYRLTRVNDSTGAMLEDYNYNKTGDRTLKQFAGQAAQVYAYLSGTHRLGSVDGVNRSYDGNGNTTDRGDGVTLAYNDQNRLYGADVPGNWTEYGYSGRGERVHKAQDNSGALAIDHYIYNETGQMLHNLKLEDVNVSNAKSHIDYLFVDAIPVAQIRAKTLSYIEADHLGTPRVSATPATNDREWGWDLLGDAFGGSEAATAIGANAVELRYPGQWMDSETGLHYNYFRDYEAGRGRYLESDPIGLNGGINTYSYAGGNSLEFVDPLGLAHRSGQWKDCGGGCRIRIDGDHVGEGRHLHWECNGQSGEMGEFGGISHGGSSGGAPNKILQCARKFGFAVEPEPNSQQFEMCPDPSESTVPKPSAWHYLGAGAVFILFVIGGITGAGA